MRTAKNNYREEKRIETKVKCITIETGREEQL